MNRVQRQLSLGMLVLLTGGVALAEETKSPTPPMTINDQTNVGMEYTLLSGGKVIDSTEGRGPFHYVQGAHQVLPALEQELAGLHVGDTREITLSPEKAYGVVDPAAFVEVPKSKLPQDVTPKVGMALRGVNPDGKNFRATVREIKGDNVVLDLNHPLAGKTLVFKVKITDLSPAKTP